jgi:hypothetical protein
MRVYTPVSWDTVCEFYIKLIKYQIIGNAFGLCVNRYLIEIEKPSKVLFNKSVLVNKNKRNLFIKLFI